MNRATKLQRTYPQGEAGRRWARRLIAVRPIVIVTEKCSECGTYLDAERSCPKCADQEA